MMKHLKPLISLALAFVLVMALPLSASAAVSASLLDADHKPLGASVNINDLEDTNLILCLKGGVKFQGANINLFDADGKRIEKAISFWGGSTSEDGHFDIPITIKRGTFETNKKYSFKVDCVLKNDSSNVIDTCEYSFTVGESSKDDESKDDDKKDDDSKKDDDTKKDDDNKKDDKKDDNKGNNGKGDQGGSGSGKTKGDSGKSSKGSASGKDTGKADSDNSSDAETDDDSKASVPAATEQPKTPKGSAKPKGDAKAQEQIDSGSVLGAMGAVYSLSDGSQATQGNAGGGVVPLYIDVTGIPWLFSLLVVVLALALPAGVVKRLACTQVGLRQRSRLRVGLSTPRASARFAQDDGGVQAPDDTTSIDADDDERLG